jgi:glucose-6-phosphate isomerase
MTQFRQVPAYARLAKLAQRPIDLTEPGVMTTDRVMNYFRQAVGFDLSYAAERVDDSVLAALVDLAHERHALDQMQAMQNGQIVNYVKGLPSEERAALHTAMRDLFDHPNPHPVAAEAAAKAKLENEKLAAFLAEIDAEGHWTDLILVGIGGSELGPKALYMALETHLKKGRKVHFVSNVDPDETAAAWANLNLRNTLVAVVSKSGTTLETLTNETLLRAAFESRGMESRQHFIAVTGEGSPMLDPKRYRASFLMWDFVGGRYSATSMVGGVPLGFAFGYPIFREILEGAHAMDLHALEQDPAQNLPLLAALFGIWNRDFLDHDTLAILPYSRALSRFSAHLQQLDMESNGKHIEKETGRPVDFETGPIIWGEPGTNGQHSFYQQLHQGTTIVPMEFIGFRRSQIHQDLLVEGTTSQEKLMANLLAQVIAFAVGQKSDNPNKQCEGNRPSLLLLADQLTAKNLGALLAFYEHKVAFQGFIWGINSFDQEGVQLGKRLASSILEILAEDRGGPDAAGFPVAEAYLELLKLHHLRS